MSEHPPTSAPCSTPDSSHKKTGSARATPAVLTHYALLILLLSVPAIPIISLILAGVESSARESEYSTDLSMRFRSGFEFGTETGRIPDVFRLENTEGRPSNNPVRADGASFLPQVASDSDCQVVLRGLPAGTIVVIGSVDLTARKHAVRLTFDGQPAESSAGNAIHFNPAIEHSDLRYPVLLDELPTLAESSRLDETFSGSTLSFADSVSRVVAAPTNSPCENKAYIVPATRQFLAPFFDDAGSGQHFCEAVLVGQTCSDCGSCVAVYCATEAWNESEAGKQADIRSLATRLCCEMSENVLGRVESLLGCVDDPDCDGHLTILLTELDKRKTAADAPIHGCVRAADFLSAGNPFGGDIVYLDMRVPQTRELTAILSHETAHAAVYSRALRYLALHPEMSLTQISEKIPVWLNEALAHVVERMLAPGTENFSRRLQAFLEDPGQSAILISEASMPVLQRRGGTRAASTLFLESIIRHPGELNLLLDLDISPLSRIERIRQKPFAEIFRNWCVQNQTRILSQAVDKEAVSDSWKSSTRISAGGQKRLSLRGTAVIYQIVAEPLVQLTIQSHARAELQVTVLLPQMPAVSPVAAISQTTSR